MRKDLLPFAERILKAVKQDGAVTLGELSNDGSDIGSLTEAAREMVEDGLLKSSSNVRYFTATSEVDTVQSYGEFASIVDLTKNGKLAREAVLMQLELLNIKKIGIDIDNGEFLTRTRWWPLGISSGSLFVSIISCIVSALVCQYTLRKQDRAVQKEDLSRILQETRNETLREVQHLYQTKPVEDKPKS